MATLGFSTQWPKRMGGGETGFIPKIYNGLLATGLADLRAYDDYDYLSCRNGLGQYFPDFRKVKNFNPKLHTIREDEKSLWKPGRKIHMVVFNRTKNRFQFAPVLEVKSVQKIIIKPCGVEKSIQVGYHRFDMYNSEKGWINGGVLENLIFNDGFDSVEQFFKWFNEDFTGKIIHWTELKY